MLQTRELMEEFRGLLNLEVPERKLLTFVFFGLPEIEENLKLDPPLQQRVAMRYRLSTLTPADTGAYIEHRLRQAGASRNPFSEDSIQRLHAITRGTPRAINTLADNALLEAYFDANLTVEGSVVERVGENLGLMVGERLAPRSARESGARRPVDLGEIDRYLEGLRRR
jgi:type II secretory pathway predicted ATPase ExeA